MFNQYIDFEVQLGPLSPSHHSITVSGPGGDASGAFLLPTNDSTFQALATRLAALDTDEETLVELGTILFQTLFQGAIEDVYRRSQAILTPDQGLRLRLNIAPSDAELMALPWEFLYDPDQGPLALLDTPIVRYLPQPLRIPSLKTELPLKVLVTGAHTPPQIDVERELNEVIAALDGLGQHAQITVEPHLTPPKLQQLLRGGFHVWHFVGHGGFARDGTTGQLLFEDATGDAEPLSALQLGMILNRSGVRLIVLDACHGAKLSTDPFRNTAPALIRAQIPAVVAMQFTVPEATTRAFAKEFYRALAQGFPIDACVTEGRMAVMNATGLHNPDWGIPVVFTRAPDGQLFDLHATTSTTATTQSSSPSGSINITIGSGQRLDASSINVSNIGNIHRGGDTTDMESENDDRSNDIADLNDEIALNRRRLSMLRKQAALTGAMTDPSITIQIEDLESEIAKLERQLKQLRSISTNAQLPPSTAPGSSPSGQNANIGSSGRDSRSVVQEDGSAATVPQKIIPLTLRLMPQSNITQITWEADVIGRSSSIFQSPYDAATLPLVIKALDAFQYGQEFAGERLDQAEQEQLTGMGLWAGTQPSPEIHKRVGRALYNALVADSAAATALSTARNIATSQGLPLSYLLRFPSDAVDLAALPWELLWDNISALLLSRGKQAEFVRYLDLDQALPPPSPPGNRLRILAIAPVVAIDPDIREAERKARRTAWADLSESGLVELEELSPATATKLVDRIQNGPPIDIVHFYGHGRYKDGQGALLFDAPSGKSWISADRLATLLGDTRLIMLHACQSAMIGEMGLLTGVSPALSAAGVPVVVAMQLTVRTDAATRFAEVVYRNLARGESVQRAVAQARQALYFEEEDGASWYVPTLTIRARDTGPLRLVRMPS